MLRDRPEFFGSYGPVEPPESGRLTIQAYEQTRDALPHSFLQEPAENVTPTLFRKFIRDLTDAPVMQNRHLSRLKAAVRFARSELHRTGSRHRGVLAHYDHSKRIPERADWLRRWADHVAECVGRSGSQPVAGPILHLYETSAGLPEVSAAKEPARGRRYVGAFTAAGRCTVHLYLDWTHL